MNNPPRDTPAQDAQRPLNLPDEDTSVFYPPHVASHMEFMGRLYAEKGDGETLLEALQGAAFYRVPPPLWCLRALDGVLDEWDRGASRHFGDVIKIQRPSGWRQADNRRRSRKYGQLPLVLAVYASVTEAARSGYVLNAAPASGESAFSLAAQEFSISSKLAEKWYYEIKHKIDRVADLGARENDFFDPESDFPRVNKKLSSLDPETRRRVYRKWITDIIAKGAALRPDDDSE